MKFEAQERAVRNGEVTTPSSSLHQSDGHFGPEFAIQNGSKTDSSNIINLPKRAGRSWEDSAGKDVKLMTWKIPSKTSRVCLEKNAGECVVSRIGMGGSWSAIWLGSMGCLGRKCQQTTPFRFGGVCFWRCRCSIFYFPCHVVFFKPRKKNTKLQSLSKRVYKQPTESQDAELAIAV